MVGVIKPQPAREWGIAKENGLFQVLEKVLYIRRGKDRNVEL